MPLTIEPLNADSTFLLTLSHSIGARDAESPSQTFTILIDPWLTGPSSILHPVFQLSHHVSAPVISSLADLKREPDLVVVSQAKPDHCHRETLTTLPRNSGLTRIVAPTATAKKILSWRHFHPVNILALAPYNPDKLESTVLRLPVPASMPDAVDDGEITVADISSRFDLTGLHNAIAITYRPPRPRNVDLDLATEKDCDPSLLSIVYTPHGVSPSTISPYIETLLSPLGAIPATVLIHSTSVEQNPWYMGGMVCNGAPAGVKLAKKLKVMNWISAHDEQKQNSGISTWLLKSRRYDAEEIADLLRDDGLETVVHSLHPGESLTIE